MMKRSLAVLLIVLLAFTVAACNRSMTTGEEPNVPPTVAGEEGAPAVTADVMQQLQLFVTQTAMAAGGIVTTPGATLPPIDSQATPAAPAPTVEAAVPTATVAAPQPTAAPAQPTATFVTVPTATPGIPTTWTVQSGESLFCLGRRFNVNPTELANMNGLGNFIQPGTVLRIPQTGNPFPADRALAPRPDTVVVAAGETIYGIACRYGDVSPEAIAYANGLAAPFNLTAGQTLQIP